MYLVEFNKKFYDVPTDWNELSGRQLVRCMDVLHADLPGQQKQLKLLQILTQMSIWHFFFCPVDELQDKIYLTFFLFTTNHLTKNLIPAYDGLFGPADQFNNLTGGEYAHTEHYFAKCLADLSRDHLIDLVGTLYRPSRPDYDHRINAAGDHREPFNDKILDHYRHSVRHWPRGVLLAVYTWYGGCHAQLIKDFPRAFGGSADDGGHAQFGHWSIIRWIAEKGNHGTFKEVEKMLLKEMMMELTELFADSDRLDAYGKQQQPAAHE